MGRGARLAALALVLLAVALLVGREAVLLARPAAAPRPAARGDGGAGERGPGAGTFPRLTPVATPAALAEAPFMREYRRLYRAMVTDQTEPRRLVVFRGDTTGWGNRLRAQATAFLLALAAGRLFAVDHPAFSAHYRPPDGLDWEYSALRVPGARQRVLNPHGNKQDRELVQTANLSAVLPQPVWVHKKGNSFHVFLTRNPHYADRIAALFGTRSAFYRTMAIMTVMMQRPAPAYRAAAEAALAGLGWPRHRRHIAVQIRTNFDDSSARHIRKHLPHTWDCVQAHFRNLSLAGRPAWIFFATDDASLRPTARQQLAAFGDVVYHDAPVVHTSKVRGHGIAAGMIEFYAMSRADTLVTTGSSFAMAAIRTGQAVLYAGRAGPRDGCHPLPKAHFPPEYDDRLEHRPLEYILRLPGVRRFANPNVPDNATEVSVAGSSDLSENTLEDDG